MNIIKKIFKKKKSHIANESSTQKQLIEQRVDLLIENQNFDFICETIKNGYELTEDQCKKLFFSAVVYSQNSVQLRINFNLDLWLDGIEKIKPHSEAFFNKCLHYMSMLLKDYYDGPTALSPSYNPKLLKNWLWGSDIKEHMVCKKFVEKFYDEFLLFNSPSSIDEMKKDINKLYKKCESDEKLSTSLTEFHKLLSNMLNEKMNDGIQNELFLKEVKSVYAKAEKMTLQPQKVLALLTNQDDEITEYSQSELSKIHQLIKQINVANLDEIQRLEFNNLTQQQLPQIMENYQNIDKAYRDKIIQGESANSILEKSLEQLNLLLLSIKENETENQLAAKIGKLKINHEYLKAKA